MKSSFLLAGIIFLLTEVAAQQLEFEFDYAQFGFDSSSNFIELYYSFNQSTLTKTASDSILNTKAELSISISDSASGEIFVDKTWSVENPVPNNSNAGNNLIGVLGFVLLKGAYKCVVSGADALKQGTGKTLTEYINVKPFLDDRMSMSDIQLASGIIQDSPNKESIFYKNTYEVTPNPTSVFGQGQPVLFYYSELYNLPQMETGKGLRLEQLLFNSRGELVNKKRKDLTASVNSRVEVGRIMANKLPTDTYTLILNLIDSVSSVGVSSSKRFFVYNPSITSDDTLQQHVSPVLSTQFGVMSEEELDDIFEKARYIATTPEIEQYEVLSTIEGKREFLYNFWKARDEKPADDFNQTYSDYMKRVEESNLRFKSLSKEGWKTDRGRVYLIYGEPSEIERYPNQIETKPYEIWNYHNLEGGVFFIFADLFGFSEYQLVHSNKRGEYRDDYWMRRITVQ